MAELNYYVHGTIELSVGQTYCSNVRGCKRLQLKSDASWGLGKNINSMERPHECFCSTFTSAEEVKLLIETTHWSGLFSISAICISETLSAPEQNTSRFRFIMARR